MKLRIAAESRIPEETEGICGLKLKIRFAKHRQAKITKVGISVALKFPHVLHPCDSKLFFFLAISILLMWTFFFLLIASKLDNEEW